MRGDRLKKLRTDKKITQGELGKIINVTKVSISGYENGNRSPDTDTLQKLADYFDVTTDFLLGREEKESASKSNNHMEEFESWMNDPKINKFYKEFKESPDERRQALLAAWEYLKSMDKK